LNSRKQALVRPQLATPEREPQAAALLGPEPRRQEPSQEREQAQPQSPRHQ
jgi:hypothetical protein